MEEEKSLNRKEREKLYRRKEIIYAAVKLFSEKGYEHSTLDEIAEASEFGKGTIYNYFQNKEEIYLAVVDEIMENHSKIIKDISETCEDFLTFITEFTKATLKISLENKDAFLLMVRLKSQSFLSDPSIKSGLIQKHFEKNNKILSQKFSNAIKNKVIRSLDINSLMNIYRSMIFPYLHNLICCNRTEDINPEKEAEFIISVFFNGILVK